MRDRFTQQMEKLHVELIEMGALCEQAISRAYQVLMEEDPQAAQDLRKKDAAIDEKEREIESRCLKLLLQQQPVASDLRQVSAALKMITDMERIGDQASDIAEIVQTTHLKAPGENIRLKDMAQITKRLDSITKAVDTNLQSGQYDVRAILNPSLLQLQDTLLQVDRFFSKATHLVDKIEKNPYDSLFGKRQSGDE